MARHYGVVRNQAILPQLGCGYLSGQPNFEQWPFGKVVSLSSSSNISINHDLDGCGACLEVKCTEEQIQAGVCFPNSAQIVSVYDICATQGRSIQCGDDELAMPAYVFQQLAPYQRGQVSVEYRQIECQPSENITLVIEEYAGKYLKIRLQDVAGDGSVAQVEVRNMPESEGEGARDLNSFWMNMTKAGLASFELSGIPPLPLDMRITSGDRQVIVLRNVITENTKEGEYDTRAQFKLGQFPTRFPIVQDLATFMSAKQEEEQQQSPEQYEGYGAAYEPYTQDTTDCDCKDELPVGVPFDCEEQLKFGRCNQQFMIDGDYCALTCGRCRCSSTQAASIGSVVEDTDGQVSPAPPLPPPPSPPQLQDPPLLAVEMPKGVENDTICMFSLEGLLSNSPDFRMFYEGLEAVGLIDALRDPYLALTILAPNNYAFNILMESIQMEWEQFKTQYPGLLQRILLYNMIPGVWDTSKFMQLNDPLRLVMLLPYTSADVSAIRFAKSTQLNFNGPTNVVRTVFVDLSVCKSLIHYTDGVLIPFTDYSLTQLAEFSQVTELPFFDSIGQSKSPNPASTTIFEEPQSEQDIDTSLLSRSGFLPQTFVLPSESQFSPPPPPTQIRVQAIRSINEEELIGECGYDVGFQDVVSCPSPLRVLERTPCLGVFLQLVRVAGYEDEFQDITRKFTIFVPTNSSFEALFDREGTSLQEVLQTPNEVRVILGYHVINEAYSREQLQLIAASDDNERNTFIQFMQGSLPLQFMSSPQGDKVVVSGIGSNATIEREIYTCESYIQVIDNVLLPTQPSPPATARPREPLEQNPAPAFAASPQPAQDPFTQLIASPSPTPNNVFLPQSPNRMTGTLPAIAPVQAPQEASLCSKLTLQQFFAQRGSSLGDIRYFDIMLVLSKLQDQVYYTSRQLVVLVPNNDGVDRGLATLNETFVTLLGSANQAFSALVQYHVLVRDSGLEGEFEPGQADDTKGILTSYGRNTVKISTSDYAEDGTLVSISGDQTSAKVLERIETCQGVVYVIDNLLLPKGFSL